MNKHSVAQQLLLDEGLRLKPYRCTAGKLTIGVGRNLDDVGITEAEAMGLLDNDLQRVWSELVINFPWIINAPEIVQEVLANMCFNLGIKGLLGFRNTLVAMKEGRFKDAAKGMLDSQWARQVEQRAIRLAARIEVLEK